MGVLADHQIENLSLPTEQVMLGHSDMIKPFSPQQHRPGVISYGTSAYGYDVRLGYIGKIFSPIHGTEIDPKNFDPKLLETIDLAPIPCDNCDGNGGFGGRWTNEPSVPESMCGYCDGKKQQKYPGGKEQPHNYFRIPPHSFMLGESIETFDIPRGILVTVIGKSTYARCGLIVNVTPGEPEWKGKWTIELSNTTPLPIRVYAGEGIMQCVFHVGDQVCRTSYKDKVGKYQDQKGLTLPIVKKD